MSARYVVGIDLGTTHSAVARSPVDRLDVQVFELPQLVAPGETAARPLLPSFLYLPAAGELADHERALPWGGAERVVGELARRQGARVPGRLASSAKSWLCHAGVDRKAAILPWSAPEGVPKISPIDASAAYLTHIRQAWDAAHPDAPLAEQDVVLTVPASFDGIARDLTMEAARQAELAHVRLLEEPQAAYHDFLGAHAADLGTALGGAKLVLVIDVGGGTTDLTLVQVRPGEGDGQFEMERVAVGEHLMLGGDNMDVALAHYVEQIGEIGRLDATEWSALVQASRHAKERLLSADAPDEVGVPVQRRGSRLIGGTRTVVVGRDAVHRLLLDGFLPLTAPDEVPARRGRTALTALGLPYAADAAISRHICAFLRRHHEVADKAGAASREGLPRPDVLLLNGGVFNAPAIAERMSAVLDHWYGEQIPRLSATSLDLAVARGAVQHGLVRRGFGQRITGGSARAYYVGVESAKGERRAICVVPRGMEEGTSVDAAERPLQLVLGRPVSFPLYTSTGDRTHAAGELVGVDDELDPLPPVQTVLKAGKVESQEAPVTLSSTLTEIGTLELYLTSPDAGGAAPRKWRLEFAVRSRTGGDAPPPTPATELPKRFDEARRHVERVFGGEKGKPDPKRAKALRRSLEDCLGVRGEWSSIVCRELWSILWSRRQKRAATPEHELTWYRFAGWTLRPGFGAPLDDWRIGEMWTLFEKGPVHDTEKAVWVEWWLMWRRIAGGLEAEQQDALFETIRLPLAPWSIPKKRRPKGQPMVHGRAEMVLMMATLERLSAAKKQEAGDWILERLGKVKSWWPVGRLGARSPFHGSAHDVVPSAVAEQWLAKVLEQDWHQADGAAFAAVLLARMTGDRNRDLTPELRETVAKRLKELMGKYGWLKGADGWITLVLEATTMSDRDARRVFGDTLPAGLRLS